MPRAAPRGRCGPGRGSRPGSLPSIHPILPPGKPRCSPPACQRPASRRRPQRRQLRSLPPPRATAAAGAQGGVLGGKWGRLPSCVSGELGVGRQVFSMDPLSSSLLGEKCPTAFACAQDYKLYIPGGESWRSLGALCWHPLTFYPCSVL